MKGASEKSWDITLLQVPICIEAVPCWVVCGWGGGKKGGGGHGSVNVSSDSIHSEVCHHPNLCKPPTPFFLPPPLPPLAT